MTNENLYELWGFGFVSFPFPLVNSFGFFRFFGLSLCVFAVVLKCVPFDIVWGSLASGSDDVDKE